MKIMFAGIGAYGHVYPMLPLAIACIEAGHQVQLATGGSLLGRLAVPTVRGYPEFGLAESVAETRRRYPDAEGRELAMLMFGDVTAERVAPSLTALAIVEQPDLIVYDAMTTGAGVAADVLGIPAITFGISLIRHHYEGLHGVTRQYQRDRWTAAGRTPPADGLLAQAFLNAVPPSLQAAGGEVPVPSIPIRTVPHNEATATVPAWLTEARDRPAVYLTLGTVSFGAVEVLRRAIDDLAALDIDLLVTVGPEGDPTLLGAVPDNVHLEHFVAQSRVLSLVDVAVHHGGTGTVLGAFAAGRPQLLVPQGADQFFNAEIVAGAGLGRALPNDAQQPGAIRAAVEAMLGSCPERVAAEGVAAEIAAMPSPAEVVPELERVAGH